MDPRHFLPVPIRLRHAEAGFHDRLAALGTLCLRAKNLAVELAAMTDAGGAALRDGDRIWWPAAGLSLARRTLAGVHALRAAQLRDYPGVLELDFAGERHPLGLAVPTAGAASLASLVADFCGGEREPEELLEWRAALAPRFEPCPCCKSAIERKRAHADAHPLAPILADAVAGGLELHVRVAGKSFAFERFLRPAKMDLNGAITVNDLASLTILRIDPALVHSVQVGTVVTDLEKRTVVRAHDLLGNETLALSLSGDRFVAAWHRYAAVGGC